MHLSPDQESFIRQAIEAGRFHRREDAVQEAMLLWEERERRRMEILAAIDESEAALDRGEGRVVTSQADLEQLAKDVARRGMERLSAEQNRR